MADEPKKKLPGKITQVAFGMTINIGNYETVRFDLTAQVAPDESWQEVLEAVKLRSQRIRKRLRHDYGLPDEG